MVHLKPKSKPEEVAIASRGFHLRHLLLFIFGSAIVHALIFLLLARYEASKPVTDKEESKPIEFVVVPPEEPAPTPSETNNNAENSVAEPNVQSPTAPDTEIAEEPATTPPPPSEPKPSPEVTAQPEPAPQPKPSAENLISSSDAPVNTLEPKKKETTAPDNVATSLPPKTEPKPSSSSEGSAADLLGGDYQKTLANSGGAFFSPEALNHKTVLDPSQIDALQDLDLSAYIAKLQRYLNEQERIILEQEYSAIFVVNIQKNGQVSIVEIKNLLGSKEYNRLFTEQFEQISPFPPLPPEFPLESLQNFPIEIYRE